MGFTLKLANAPAGIALWNANFAENAFGYEPLADSGWLSPSASWDYPSDPLGCTTLRIWAIDTDNNILFDYSNLGPIEDSKSYTFYVTTVTLSAEGVEPPVSKFPMWLIVAAVIGVILLARRK